MIGIWEILGILIIVGFIIYLGKRAPKVARETGRSIGQFKQGLEEIPKSFKKGVK